MKNFMSIGAKQSISLDKQGLVGVVAPNGSGKSSLVEALVWCIWGETLRDLKADEVINNKNKEDCEVTLDIEEGLQQYQITRYRNKSDARKKNDVLVTLNGVDATQGTITDTQSLINEIVGITFNTFAQSVLLTANTKSFCTLQDGEQKEVLEDILNIDLLRKAQAVAKKEITNFQTILAGHLGRLEPIADHIKSVEGDIKTLKVKSEVFEKERDVRGVRIQASIADTEEALKAATSARDELGPLNNRLKSLKNDVVGVLAEIAGQQDAIKAIETTVAANLRKLSNKKVEQDTIIDMSRASIARLAKMAGTQCDTCYQAIDVDTAERQMEETEKVINAADNTLIHLVMLEGKLADAGARESSPHRDALGPLRDSLKAIHVELEALEDSLRIQYSKSGGLEAFQQKLDVLKASIEDEASTQNPYTELIDSGTEEIKTRKKEATLLKAKVKSVELDLKGLRFWEKGFGNKGLKSYIMDNVVPFLNKRAQKYADIMSGGTLQIQFSTQTRLKGGALREKFNVSVVNEEGADVYKGNSSGERRRSDVAIGWALADLAATRASKPIRFRGLDEPFENLDADGIDAVFKLLQHATDEYETIFCMTHSRDLTDRFTKLLTVQKKHGYSKFTQ